MSSVACAKSQMRFRGRSYMAFALAPVPPIVDWLAELDATIAGTAGYFVGRPVVLDLSGVTISRHAIAHLVSELSSREIRVMGIEGADPAQLGPDLPPPLSGGRAAAEPVDPPARSTAPAVQPRPAQTSLTIEAPVRSGQTIDFPYGDVIVLGSLASGAEITAGGSIHVYGALRGRALAGCNGNARARVFCSRLEAELLAVDGYYRTAEDLDSSLLYRPAQAWLDSSGLLMVTALD